MIELYKDYKNRIKTINYSNQSEISKLSDEIMQSTLSNSDKISLLEEITSNKIEDNPQDVLSEDELYESLKRDGEEL